MRDEGDLFEQFTHTVQCVRQLERVTEVKHCVGACVRLCVLHEMCHTKKCCLSWKDLTCVSVC